MYWHYLKISALVVIIALLTYVFFPVSRPQGQLSATQAQARNSTATARHPAKVAKASRHNTLHRKARSAPPHLARSKTRSIRPATTLRDAETESHIGPPSKMYGGL